MPCRRPCVRRGCDTSRSRVERGTAESATTNPEQVRRCKAGGVITTPHRANSALNSPRTAQGAWMRASCGAAVVPGSHEETTNFRRMCLGQPSVSPRTPAELVVLCVVGRRVCRHTRCIARAHGGDACFTMAELAHDASRVTAKAAAGAACRSTTVADTRASRFLVLGSGLVTGPLVSTSRWTRMHVVRPECSAALWRDTLSCVPPLPAVPSACLVDGQSTCASAQATASHAVA